MHNSFWYQVGKDYLLPIISIIISLIALYRTVVYAPQYATVTKDGTILSMPNFGEYGLKAEKIEFKGYPAYELTFKKEPEYFDVNTRESATEEVVKSNQINTWSGLSGQEPEILF